QLHPMLISIAEAENPRLLQRLILLMVQDQRLCSTQQLQGVPDPRFTGTQSTHKMPVKNIQQAPVSQVLAGSPLPIKELLSHPLHNLGAQLRQRPDALAVQRREELLLSCWRR